MIKEFKCVMQRLFCDNCGTEMQHDGYVVSVHSLQNSYKCPKCEREVSMSEEYPRIDRVVEEGTK